MYRKRSGQELGVNTDDGLVILSFWFSWSLTLKVLWSLVIVIFSCGASTEQSPLLLNMLSLAGVVIMCNAVRACIIKKPTYYNRCDVNLKATSKNF